ncbi:MAG: arylsulfatase A [Flammeovirgaceae bacterium]|nr:arylsulfatase A [Flammeovirgaceae bacterium]
MSTKIKLSLILLIITSILFISCKENSLVKDKPNVILIMADDIGFEALSVNGSLSYNTPFLDSLASNGINFTKAFSQPLCTPSRVKLMTGKYNYRNYEHFTFLNSNQKTFGNLFKDNGYKTAIVGKWQLNGLQINEVEKHIAQDNERPYKFGFDEYSLWQLTKLRAEGERFANPLIEQNGKVLERDINAYGPDIVSDYAVNFIRENKDQPFFIYYPMLLVHDPFVPTPDSPEWNSLDTRSKSNRKFFKDMVAYMDKIVGKIITELKSQGVYENTLILFIGDNGTSSRLTTNTSKGQIRGAKGNTITHGIHVPMIASWPSMINNSRKYSGLINFNDFYATFSDILGVVDDSDGTSMMDIFIGENIKNREIATIYYDPMWSDNVSKYRSVFTQDNRYKLYKDGRFYDIENDVLETSPLKEEDLTKGQKNIKNKLSKNLSFFPELPNTN